MLARKASSTMMQTTRCAPPRARIAGAAAGLRARVARRASSASAAATGTSVGCHFEELVVKGAEGLYLPEYEARNLTEDIRGCIERSGFRNGIVNVMARHTTTAVSINEYEPQLMADVRQWLQTAVPPSHPYLHNELAFRPEVTWENEPINAHSHIMSMVLGQTLSVPLVDGALTLGTYQSVIHWELDGRGQDRKVAVQIMGG